MAEVAVEAGPGGARTTPDASRMLARLHPSVLGIVAAAALVPGAAVAGYVAQATLAAVAGPTELDSLRSANGVLYGGTKVGEFLFPTVALFLPLLGGWVAWIRARAGRLRTDSRTFLVILGGSAFLALLPMVVSGSIAPLASLPSGPLPLVLVVQAGPGALWVLLTWHRSRGSAAVISPGTASLSLSFGLSALGLVVALRSLAAPRTIPQVTATLAAAAAIGMATAAYSRVISKEPGETPWLLTRASSFAAALCIPLLWPPQIVSQGGTYWPPGVDDRAWKAFSLAVLLVLGAHLVWRWRLPNRGPDWPGAVSSAAVAVFLVPLRVIPALPYVNADDYHMGESFSPAILWSGSGQAPYLDQDVVRGLIQNYLPQWTNEGLAAGQAATLGYVYPAIAFGAVWLSMVILRRVVGLAMAIFAAGSLALANSYVEADLITVSVLLGLIAMLLAVKRHWFTGFAVSAILMCLVLLYPMLGMASLLLVGFILAAGTLGLAFGPRNGKWWAPVGVLAGIAVAFCLIAVSPLGGPALAAFRYVTANAGSNTEAFGIALSFSHSLNLSAPILLQFAFVLAVPASLALLMVVRERWGGRSWSQGMVLAVAVVPLLWVGLLFGRYMGRLEAMPWAPRPTWGTLVVLALVVPGVAMLISRPACRTIAWGSLALATVLSAAALPVGAGDIVRTSLGGLVAPEVWASSSASAVLPRIGVGNAVPSHLDDQLRLHEQTSTFPAGERVLNLTNRGALFAYQGWSNPLSKLAPYNIESESSEQRSIDRLSSEPPTHALLNVSTARETRVEWDGASLTLRNPDLARWVMDNYSPVECGGSIWGLLDVGSRRNPEAKLSCGGPSPEPTSYSRASLWARSVGAPENLELLPATWGRRAKPTSGSAWQVAPVSNQGTNPVSQLQDFSIGLGSPERSDGSELPGLLRLSMVCEGEPAPTPGSAEVFVSWATADQSLEEFARARFRFDEGSFLFPLDAYPAWSEPGDRPDAISISTNRPCGGDWRVEAELGTRS